MVIPLVLWLFALTFPSFVDSVGTGTVSIGLTPAQLIVAGLTENPTLYTSSRNDASGSFPVFLNITPPGTPYESGVNIFCEVTPAGAVAGYSQITFTSPAATLNANAGTISGTVSFTVVRAGRAVDVQCYGVSTITSADQQFVRDSSLSEAVKVQVTEPATVNFCSQTVVVPNIFGLTTGSFTLKLSEPVRENSVTVTCSVTTNTNAGGFLSITISPGQADVGASSVVMSFAITTAVGKDITISCSAQSQNNGRQFLTAASAGEAVFTEDKAVIKLYPSRLKIYGTIFEPILMLDEPLPAGAKDVNFACTTQLVVDDAAITGILNNYVCEANPDTSSVPASTTASPDALGEWVFTNANPVFKPGENMKQLRVERRNPVNNSSREYVLVVCCVPSSINQSPKYVDEKTSMVAEAVLSEVYAVDFNTATDLQFVAETETQNPAFVRLAPCPCDLTPQICDLGCCCDANCTDGDRRQFDCLPGMYGGATQDAYKDESCLADPFPKPNWHKLLCVVSEENPLLGSSYPTIPLIKTNNLFAIREQSAPNSDNFAETEPKNSQENVNTTLGYTLGISIKTQGENGINGILSLPRKVFDGRCERKAPVRFLTDSQSDCVIRMTEQECKDPASSFNAQSYVQSSGIKSPACPTPLGVVSHPSSTHARPRLATVATNYFCATTVDSYLVSKQPPTPPTSSLASVNPPDYAGCAFNDFGLYDCGLTSTTPVTTTPDRCGFDNGETQPPPPVWDNTNKICRNAVLDVKYTFAWSGTRLEELTADFVLGDVPAEKSYTEDVTTTETVVDPGTGQKQTQTSTQTLTETYPTDVSQKYNVQFFSTNIASKTRDPNLLSELSGNPGYLPYKPIIGAVQVDNTTWDANKKYWPKYFKPDSQNLDCPNVEKGQVNFDEAVSGNCLLYLNLNDFTDCDLLRRYVLQILDSLFPMEFLSMVGNPNQTEPSHWLRIERQNLTDIMSPNITGNLSALQLSKSRCDDVPMGISLDVMFADSGTLNDKFIQRLVNARINYTLAPFELKCTGTNARDCVEGATGVQSFPLFSATNYMFVRSELAVISRWESFHYQCVQEFCREEAMFPFTRYFQGGTYEESLLWMIAIVSVTLFIFMITRPWW